MGSIYGNPDKNTGVVVVIPVALEKVEISNNDISIIWESNGSSGSFLSISIGGWIGNITYKGPRIINI